MTWFRLNLWWKFFHLGSFNGFKIPAATTGHTMSYTHPTEKWWKLSPPNHLQWIHISITFCFMSQEYQGTALPCARVQLSPHRDGSPKNCSWFSTLDTLCLNSWSESSHVWSFLEASSSQKPQVTSPSSARFVDEPDDHPNRKQPKTPLTDVFVPSSLQNIITRTWLDTIGFQKGWRNSMARFGPWDNYNPWFGQVRSLNESSLKHLWPNVEEIHLVM